jgi:hypothetical protein
MLRFFAEMWLATQADIFAYNPQSTMHWIVRRMASRSLTFVALKQDRAQRSSWW